MRDYFDNRWHGEVLEPGTRVPVPMRFANFDQNLVPEGTPPREWMERLHEVRRWSRMPRGGHFAAAEEPVLLARDLAAFFESLA
jgi:pimeloyl-ACP methyl ester carboxylesterase